MSWSIYRKTKIKIILYPNAAAVLFWYKQIWEYKNSNMKEFENFMMDRAGVESFKAQIRLFVGDVKGEPMPGELGLYPDKPLSK